MLMMDQVCKFTASTLLALSLSACMITDIPEVADSDVPDAWQGPLIDDAQIWPDNEWWQSFNNEELNTLIIQVQENNLDLANNQRNLELAQLNLREAGFNLLPIPVVNVGTGAIYSDSSASGSSTPSVPLELSAGFTYNDILSKPSTYNKAQAEYDSRVAQVADTALNTLGTASSTYFQLLLIRDRIEASIQNVENAEEIGKIAQARVEAGMVVEIESLQQQIAIDRERANLESLKQTDLSARASLALLLGRSVQGFDVSGQTLQNIDVPTVQPGLPSELLRRRPDLVQAEASLRGATANVDLVRTNFFPQISLTGSASASSTSLSELVSSPDSVLNISANLVQTLLDNGQRFRNMDQAKLNMESSLASYRKVVISAFNDIEVQLSNIEVLEKLGLVAFKNLGAAEESFRIAQLRYEEGVADYQTALIAQNTLFTTRNSYLDNKLLQLNAIVGLYQSLGGGWKAGEEIYQEEN